MSADGNLRALLEPLGQLADEWSADAASRRVRTPNDPALEAIASCEREVRAYLETVLPAQRNRAGAPSVSGVDASSVGIRWPAEERYAVEHTHPATGTFRTAGVVHLPGRRGAAGKSFALILLSGNGPLASLLSEAIAKQLLGAVPVAPFARYAGAAWALVTPPAEDQLYPAWSLWRHHATTEIRIPDAKHWDTVSASTHPRLARPMMHAIRDALAATFNRELAGRCVLTTPVTGHGRPAENPDA